MRRAILTLAVLLGACESDSEPEPVELLPAADRAEASDCDAVTAGPLDADVVYEHIVQCMDDGYEISVSVDGACYSLKKDGEGCPIPASLAEHCQEDDDICVLVSGDVACAVGLAIVCENENASGCETPEAINERADATLDAICG